MIQIIFQHDYYDFLDFSIKQAVFKILISV